MGRHLNHALVEANHFTQQQLTVLVVNLGWPEEEKNKEVAAAEEGDEQDADHCSLRSAE